MCVVVRDGNADFAAGSAVAVAVAVAVTSSEEGVVVEESRVVVAPNLSRLSTDWHNSGARCPDQLPAPSRAGGVDATAGVEGEMMGRRHQTLLM